VALVALAFALGPSLSEAATSNGDPYSTSPVVDTNPDPKIVETTITADEATVDVGLGGNVKANVQAFNGSIPGPTFRLKVGDTVIVHYENKLAKESAIHWHGIELPNAMDGTPLTQNQVQPGGKFLYKFKVTRPGIYWYHPHHHSSNNQVFKGLYGMIVVADPNQQALVQAGKLPGIARTKQVVLSDMTVCKQPGANNALTYDPNGPHVSGGPLPAQPPPTPKDLCETSPVDEDGAPRGPYGLGDVPAVQQHSPDGETNEGQTVLTNGVNVGARNGSPNAPGAVLPSAKKLNIAAKEGIRLQLLNASTTRYVRLRLTTDKGVHLPLLRVGGEGGLLDKAVIEGRENVAFFPQYAPGEILLPPGGRADVVARMGRPLSSEPPGVYTLWTQDFLRSGTGLRDCRPSR
jgi:FtsP/CotA-like multicopper oxidase with cupredoxin domain